MKNGTNLSVAGRRTEIIFVKDFMKQIKFEVLVKHKFPADDVSVDPGLLALIMNKRG